MNAGIEMLIERLKTHPEDFHYHVSHDAYSTPWGDILKEALNCGYITEDEQEAIRNAKVESQREYFTHRVLETLTLSDKAKTETERESNLYLLYTANTGLVYNSVNANTPLKWGAIGNNTTLNIGGTSLTQEDFENMKAMAEQWKVEKSNDRV